MEQVNRRRTARLCYQTPSATINLNGKPKMTTTSNTTAFNTDVLVQNPQYTQQLTLTTNAVGNFANSDAVATFGTDYIDLGTNAYVGSGDGVVVYTAGFSNYGEVLPTSMTFGTSTTTPTTTTENFAGATIGGLGWTSQTGIPYNGFIWSSDNPNGDAQGGLTLTQPINSTKAVVITGQPSSGKGAWVGGFASTIGGQYYAYLEFPVITAPVGTQVSVTWKHAGSVFSLELFKNDALAVANTPSFRPSSATWSTPSIFPYTFTSTGSDTLYIRVQNPTGGSYTYTPYNISDIAVAYQTQVEMVEGGMSISGTTLRVAQGRPVLPTPHLFRRHPAMSLSQRQI
jgi:hypothetical protein